MTVGAQLATVYRLVLRSVATPARVVAVAVLGLIGVIVAAAIGAADVSDRLAAGTRFVNAFGLSLYAPVVTLVFASASLGEPADDGSLVYLWLRPVRRSVITLGAFLASLSVAAPLVLTTVVTAAALTGGGGRLVWGALTATALGVLAYGAVFVLVGLRTRRALVWGLAYILLWEGFVASAGRNAARLALRAYTRSVLRDATGVRLRLSDVSVPAAVVVPLLVTVAALVLATRRLRRMEVA